jgi:myo-inositol-1(or 4)-monophosphatase
VNGAVGPVETNQGRGTMGGMTVTADPRLADLHFAEEIAREAGQVLTSFAGNATDIRTKSNPNDIVTEVDTTAEELIVERIHEAYPGDSILTEERSEVLGTTNRRWLVDPLDGTANYVRGIWPSVVSIALEIDGELNVGAVFDPSTDDMHLAAAGIGSWRNGTKLWQGDSEVQLQNAFVGISGSNRPGALQNRIAVYSDLAAEVNSVRDLGSSAMQLCLAARGGLDAHVVMDVNLWDVAAGFVIAKEAGCVVSGFDKNAPATSRRAIVAPPLLFKQLRTVLDGRSA